MVDLPFVLNVKVGTTVNAMVGCGQVSVMSKRLALVEIRSRNKADLASESERGFKLTLAGIDVLHVGAFDFGTLTTSKLLVAVVRGFWVSSTEDIWGVKRTTSAEVVLVPSNRYSNRKLIVCPAHPVNPSWLTRTTSDVPVR